MGEISKRTNIVTVSLGSGKKADVMYLFMEDICGDTLNPPRHSKAYGNLLKLKNEIKIERVRALKAFKKILCQKISRKETIFKFKSKRV